LNADRINVLITGLGGGGHGMQILKALKLSRLPYYFIGTDITQLSYGFSQVDKTYIVPPANHLEYIDTLMHIIETNDIKAVFHGSEPELRVMSRHAQALRDLGVLLPINPPELIELCTNKFETMTFLNSRGFTTPQTFLVASIDDIDSIQTYPVVCKPHVGSGGSNNVFIAQDEEEMQLISRYLLRHLKEFLVQEYVGTPDSEYTVGVLADMKGDIIGAIGVRRHILSALSNRIRVENRTGRKELGKILAISSGISQGEIGHFEEVTDHCKEVARSIGARGPVNLQCRSFGDQVYVFEINPRFSGTTSLRAMAGFNEPDILIRKHVLGEEINRISYREGVILRGLEERFVERV